MATSAPQSTLVARLKFPPYVVTTISERHVLLAGGGGSAKTGVGNRLEVYSLTPGDRIPECVADTETGDEAFMNGIFFSHDKCCYFAGGGIKGICNVLQITQRLESPKDRPDQMTTTSTHLYANGHTNGDSSLTFRGKANGHAHQNGYSKTNSTPQTDTDEINNSKLVFDFRTFKSFQCDFHPKGENESFLKCVKFVPSSSVLVTAGADGHIRVWSFPSFKKLAQVKGHSDEVRDMDVSSDGQFLCSVSHDGISQLWKLPEGSRLTQLQFQPPTKSQVRYKFRSCRFHPGRGKSNIFFTVFVPVILKTTDPSYIIRWDAESKSMLSYSALDVPNISCLSVSQSGSMLAYGTHEGSVAILDTESLLNLYTVRETHNSFVTSVEFLRSSPETRALSGGFEESVISISIDNKAVWHRFPPKKSFASKVLSSNSAFILTLLIVYFISAFVAYFIA